MAHPADAPHGVVDVDGGRDALEVRVDAAPPDLAPDEAGLTLLADVMLRARADAAATVQVRQPDGEHYAVLLVRDGIARLIRLERRAGLFEATIRVAAGETLHLTVVAAADESGISWLAEQAAIGGMGSGGEAEAAPPPPPPPPSAAPLPPAAPPVAAQPAPEPPFVEPPFAEAPGVEPPFVEPPFAEPPFAEPPFAEPPFAEPPFAREITIGDDLPAPVDGRVDGGGLEPGAPALEGAVPVAAFVDAEAPSHVPAGGAFDLVVRLSRRELAARPGTARRRGRALFDPRHDIEVGVQLRGLSFADGTDAVVTTRLPQADDPASLVFRLVAGDVGRGHITVTFTQPPVVTPLAVLAFTTPIDPVDEADEPDAGDPRVVEASVAAPPRSLADLPTLVVDESISGMVSSLRITAKVGRLTRTHTVALPDKARFVDGIYAELARIRADYAAEAETDEEAAADTVRAEVRSLGARIAAQLFGDEVNELLWRRRRRISQLVLQTSGELDIPWEIVHLVPVGRQRPDPARYFLGDLGLTRWMYGTSRPTVIPIDAHRVVAIAPDYVNPAYALPRAREEVDALGRLLAAPLRSAADPVELRRAIAEGFDLLHFAGHGRWRDAAPLGQEIAFAAFSEDHDDGTASYTDADARADLPERDEAAAAASSPLVFLSACDVGRLRSGATGLGGFAEVFLRGGVGVFIGCSWAVRDDVTAAFVRTFYRRTLGERATIGEAVLAARREAREAGDLTSLAFTVFADPRARLVPR